MRLVSVDGAITSQPQSGARVMKASGGFWANAAPPSGQVGNQNVLALVQVRHVGQDQDPGADRGPETTAMAPHHTDIPGHQPQTGAWPACRGPFPPPW